MIVVGISVTFWIDEWNRIKFLRISNILDIKSIIDDLEFDSVTIDRVNSSLEMVYNSNGDLILAEIKQKNKISYEE